jgi:Winged helix-turn-helix DNA-binding
VPRIIGQDKGHGLPIVTKTLDQRDWKCQYNAEKGWFMPIRKLDQLDHKILQHLQADGRVSLADLAAKVGLSPSPCLRRVRMLERHGVIARYVAVLDQRAVGLPVSVFVSNQIGQATTGIS